MSRHKRLNRRFRNGLKRKHKGRPLKSGGPFVAGGQGHWIESVLKSGYLYHMPTVHYSWCALMAGSGPCNCNPEVRLERVPFRRKTRGWAGEARRRRKGRGMRP